MQLQQDLDGKLQEARLSTAVHVSNSGKGRLGFKCLALGGGVEMGHLAGILPAKGARGCSRRCEIPLESSGLQSCLVQGF